jgi:hypothetical protein
VVPSSNVTTAIIIFTLDREPNSKTADKQLDKKAKLSLQFPEQKFSENAVM